MIQTNLTTTRETGIAKTDYDVFQIDLRLSEMESTVVKVRDALANSSNKVIKAIETLKEKGMQVREDSFTTHSYVVPNSVYDREKANYVDDGQKGTWTCSFQSTTMEMANTTYDKLMSLDLKGLTITPSFKVKDLDALHKLALKDAWARVQDTFNAECTILGLDSSKFEIVNYAVSYDQRESAGEVERGGRALSASAAPSGGSSKSLELESGKATVKVVLNVTFARKDAFSSFPSIMDMLKK